jgi:hypothetical protein
MAINNDLLYNAAICGFIAATVSGRSFTAASITADGAALVAAAQSFATSVDALIAEDATISTGSGDASALVGSMNTYTSAMVSAAHGKTTLMTECVRSIMSDRYALVGTAGYYATQAAAVAALYTAGIAALTNAA